MSWPADRIHLHLIAWSDATHASVGPGWQVLDNRDNPRPDWYEYGPIRRRLLAGPLDEDAFYGFFSPKFSAKTGLDHARTLAFVQAQAEAADVLLFSPQPDMGAFFLNVFEQGETFDPGFIETTEAFLAATGLAVPPLRSLVMDARQIVFSNFFVARPAFWREWLALNERLYALCEGAPGPLREQLTQATSYPGSAQRKVFIMERMASLLLALQPRWRSRAFDPFDFAWSMTRFREHPVEAVISDALKRAFRDQGWPEYLHAYAQVRERFARG